jgi:putative glutamine amidotransferase
MPIRVALATRSEDKPEPYRRALREAGLEPVTFTPDAGGSLDSVQGLLLTGGVDVDPALYGEPPVPETEAPDRERDDYESALLRAALTRDMPVLAICRGQQLFNVVCGGTLIQHLGSPRHQQKSGGAPVHDVVLEGRMAEVFGTSRAPVNSRHHQAANRIGDGLIVTARDPEDGVIEGFVFPKAKFAMGVQWHPEDMVEDQTQLKLFRAFASAMM